MTLKTKLQYNKSEDFFAAWLETSQTYLEARRERYQEYLKLHYTQHPESANLTTQLYMTYTQIVNLITKNAIAATIIMILAIGGTATSAAQFFAPEEYKPSNWFRKNPISTINSYETCMQSTWSQKPEGNPPRCIYNETTYYKLATSFTECEQFGGTVMESYPRQCQWQGELFVEEVGENIVTNSYEGWDTYENQEFNFSLKYPPSFKYDDQLENYNDGVVQIVSEDSWSGRETSVSTLLRVRKLGEFNSLQEFENYLTQPGGPQAEYKVTDFETPHLTGRKVEITTHSTTNPNQLDKSYIYIFESQGRFFFLSTKFIDGLENLNLEEQRKLTEQILQTIKFFKADTSSTVKMETFTHPGYPELQIKYPGDWKLETKKDADVSELLSEIKFSKNGLVLKYEIINTADFGFGPTSKCTNNPNLFLEVGNGFSRIRNNDGSRHYTKGLEIDMESPLSDVVSEDSSNTSNIFEVPSEASNEWISVLSDVPKGKYKACAFRASSFYMKTSATTGNPAPRNGIVQISVEGVKQSNFDLLKETDKIVASTKFDSVFD